MAKIGKPSASFKIFEVPEDAADARDNLRQLAGERETRGPSLEQSFADLGTEKRSTRISRFSRRSKPEESLEASTSNTTPETLKLAIVVPNAPVKPPRTSKKVDMRPKKLQFMEEAENSSSLLSDVDPNEPTHRYPTRASRNKISDNLRPNSTKGKQVQLGGSNGRSVWPDYDKENNGSLGNQQQTAQSFGSTNRSAVKKTNNPKNSLKPLNSQNRSKPEGAHFRI